MKEQKKGLRWLIHMKNLCLREIEGIRKRALAETRSLSMEEMARSDELLRRYDNCMQLIALYFPSEVRCLKGT